MLESLQELDEQVLLALNGLRAPFWDGFMWTVSETWTWVAMYAAILYVVCRNFSWRVAAVAVVAVVAVIVFADQLGASVIRPAVGRLRPSNLENPVSEFVQILNGKRGGRYGFPSCHAANSFGLAFITLLLFRRWGVGVFLLFWATLNSYSRIYLGVHYPGDLVAGMLLGALGAVIVYGLWHWALRSRQVTRWLKCSEQDKGLIRHTAPFRHTGWVIAVGGLTIAAVAAWSAVQIL